MKKLLLTALAITLTVSMVACGGDKEPTEPTTTEASVVTEAPAEPEATEAPAENVEGSTEGEVTEGELGGETTEGETTEGEVSGETLGNMLLADFNAALTEDASLDATALAEKLCTNEMASLIGPVTMPVEPGLLMGFNNYEVTGFEEGVMFAPMIGSVPFVGYVFTLPADADVDAFVTGLKDNADLRWNICVEADEMVAEANGNKVFFVMCPTKIEQ